MPSNLPDVSFVVLAKELSVAKSRLGLDPERSQRVALRLVEQTVRAALTAECSGGVSVVTSDPVIADQSARMGATVVAEGRPRGMNRAGAMGREHALRLRPWGPVAVMVADLPLIQSDDLNAAVLQFHERDAPMYIPDQHKVGTTLVIQQASIRLGLAFGHDSARMHRRLGYQPADAAPWGLRVDLDTQDDARAFLLGRGEGGSAETDRRGILRDEGFGGRTCTGAQA